VRRNPSPLNCYANKTSPWNWHGRKCANRSSRLRKDETETLSPQQTFCPDCGGKLRWLGEDVCETLEYVPARFKVIRTVRPKVSCAGCARILQEPAPHRPIDHGLAGPGLLAHVLVAKYSDHLPLYRQAEI
jgi:transposase